MLELPHTLIGAAIGAKIGSPLLALPLSLASHFIVDLVPHWNPSLYTETKKYGRPSIRSTVIIVFDVILSLIFGFGIASLFLPDYTKAIVIILTAFLAVLPDVIEGFYFYLKVEWKWLIKLIEFQHSHQGKAGLVVGSLTQLVTILLVLHILLS